MKRRSSPPNRKRDNARADLVLVHFMSIFGHKLFTLCNLCVLCVSVVVSQPPRHREHRGCTEKKSLIGGSITGDVSDDFVKLARAFANVLHRDALVVAVHAFVFFGGRVNRRPAISDYAELPVELAFSITAEHLRRDNCVGDTSLSSCARSAKTTPYRSGNCLVV